MSGIALAIIGSSVDLFLLDYSPGPTTRFTVTTCASEAVEAYGFGVDFEEFEGLTGLALQEVVVLKDGSIEPMP